MKLRALFVLAAAIVLGLSMLNPGTLTSWADKLGVPTPHASPSGPRSPASSKYERSKFGQAWSDDVTVAGGHNGCDTRNDILAAQLTDITFKPKTHNCVVTAGTLHDPYTGRVIEFRKANASAVQIDHVYALSLAWSNGADKWTDQKRRDFANDPINLIAVDGPTNGAKSDKSPALWRQSTKGRLPETKAGRRDYAHRYTAVSERYGLSIAPADLDALRDMSRDC